MEERMKENLKTLTHFTHDKPGHVLSLVDGQSTEYTCQLCKIPGKNLRYKCNKCPDFNLDSVCATCEPDATSFMHPDDNHVMVLLLEPDQTTKFLCSVCNQDIKGGHYWCCDFRVHPMCTKFPKTIRAAGAHEDHELKGKIFSNNPTTCHVCCHDCVGLTYQCEGCDVDFHPACLAGFGERELMDDDDADGNRRGLGRYLRLFMAGAQIWDLVNLLLSLAG